MLTALQWMGGAVGASSTVADFGCMFQTGSDSTSDRTVNQIIVYETLWAYAMPLVVFAFWWMLQVMLHWMSTPSSVQANNMPSVTVKSLLQSRVLYALMPPLLATLTRTYPAVLRAMVNFLSCSTLSTLGSAEATNAELYETQLPVDVAARGRALVDSDDLTAARLSVDMSTLCWRGNHLLWVLTWVLPVGLTYVMGMMLAIRYLLQPLDVLLRLPAKSPQRARHAARYGWLYLGYADGKWQWDLASKVFMIAQVTSMVLTGSHGGTAALCAVFVGVVRLCCAAWFAPYGVHGQLQQLYLASCAALVASSACFWFMAGLDPAIDDNSMCESRVLAGTATLVLAEFGWLAFALLTVRRGN